MKKVFKTFTIWFVIIAILEIYMNLIGRDSKSIVLIYLNPILRAISRSNAGFSFMNSGLQVSSGTITGYISIYWYIGSILSFAIYGLILDGSRCLFKHMSKNGWWC